MGAPESENSLLNQNPIRCSGPVMCNASRTQDIALTRLLAVFPALARYRIRVSDSKVYCGYLSGSGGSGAISDLCSLGLSVA